MNSNLTRSEVLLESVAIKRSMLDAGCSMLDNLHPIDSGIDKHPVTSNQYQESASDRKVFLEIVSANCHFLSNYWIYKPILRYGSEVWKKSQ